jgi:hypothetical protein
MHPKAWFEDESKQMRFWGISWKVLGVLSQRRGIEVDKKSMKAIDEVVPSTNLKELQSLLDKINFVRRFISNLSQKVSSFSPLLRTMCGSRTDGWLLPCVMSD